MRTVAVWAASASLALILPWASLPASAAQAPSTASLTRTMSARAAIDLGVALALSGHAVAIDSANARKAAALLPTLGRRDRAGLVRVVRLPGLRLGASGTPVTLLQARLAGLGQTLALDGVFGQETEAALRTVDARLGAPSDAVTEATWRALLGTRVEANGQSVWALASLYETSPASLGAWNGIARTDWLAPQHGRVWIMPADVRPSSAVLGDGKAPASTVSQPPPAHAGGPGSTGKTGKTATPGQGGGPTTPATRTGPSTASAGAPTPHGGTVLFAIDVQGPVSSTALSRLAAWLGGHQIAATVLLPVSALQSHGAAALALEGEDLGVQLGRGEAETPLRASLAGAQAETGTKPVVAYAGPYPSAAQAAVASSAGLALIVGEEGTPVAGGGVYVLAGSAPTLLDRLPAVVRSIAARGEHIGAVSATLRLSPAAG